MGLLVNAMKNETEIREEIEALRSLTTLERKDRYRELFGEQSRSNHKQFLFRHIAWRIQANAWGGLSVRARQRALEIAALKEIVSSGEASAERLRTAVARAKS